MKIPTGPRTWFNDQTGTRTVAIGAGSMPINFQADPADGGDWRRIDLSWSENAGQYNAPGSFHRARVNADGEAAFAWPTPQGRRAVRIKPMRLVKVDMATRSMQVLETASVPSSIERNGPYVTMADIYPGVDRRLRFFNSDISDGIVFTQVARDAFAAAGPWNGKMIGTVSRVDLSGLTGGVLADKNNQALSIDEHGRMSVEEVRIMHNGRRHISLGGKSFLRLHTNSGHVETRIPVYNYFTFRNGQLFLVELFDPMLTVGLPDGDLSHSARFGHDSDESSTVSIKDQIVGIVDAPTSDGTADSITVWLEWAGFPFLEGTTCALYEYASSTEDYLAKTEEINFSLPGNGSPDAFHTFDFSSGPSLTSGTDYAIVAWAQGGVGHSVNTTNVALSGFRLVAEMETYDPSTEPWPEPLTDDLNNFAVSIYCDFTEDAAGPPIGSLALMGVGR